MKWHVVILSVFFTNVLFAVDNNTSMVRYIKENTRQFAAGATRGVYEAGIFNVLTTGVSLHQDAVPMAYFLAGAGVFLPMPHIVKLCELQEQRMQARSHDEDDIAHVPQLPECMYEAGHVAGSLLTTAAVVGFIYKIWPHISDADRENLFVIGASFGAAAWITQDYGRNMRL